MGVDLATLYRARIGTFISRRNVGCGDERRRIFSAKQTWRSVSEMSSTVNLKCMDVKMPYCSHSLDLYIYNTIGLGPLQPNLPHGLHHASHLCARAALALVAVSFILIQQLLLLLSGDVETNPGPSGQHSEDDTFTPKNILHALNEVVDWKSLGVQLDISPAKLQEICVNNYNQVGDCKIAMVSIWLSSDNTCSWRKLIDALKSIGLHALAEGIREQYCPLYQDSLPKSAPQKLSSYMYARLLLVIAGMVLLALGYWWRCCMPSVQRSVYKDIGIGMNWRNNNVISSYVRGTQEQLVDLMDSGDGVRLMFATGECGNETWAGLSAEQFAKVNIPLLNYRGIQYTVSANCSAFTCNSTNGAENFLKRYLGTHLQGFDFYFPQDMQPSDQQLSNLMRNIMSLQQNNTKLTISFSFVSSATTESIGNLGTSVLTAARYAGLKFIVNLMTMNYGPKPSEEFCVVDDNQKCDMGASAIQAAKNLNLFYKVPFTEIALTPMIGMNDITNEIFTIADMKKVLEFGAKVGLAGLHYWSFDRDCQCPPDSPVAASLYCSGVQQEPLQYYNLFMGHGNTEL